MTSTKPNTSPANTSTQQTTKEMTQIFRYEVERYFKVLYAIIYLHSLFQLDGINKLYITSINYVIKMDFGLNKANLVINNLHFETPPSCCTHSVVRRRIKTPPYDNVKWLNICELEISWHLPIVSQNGPRKMP